SCDETAIAILKMKRGRPAPHFKLLANLIASQEEVHTPYGGIVPELASRRHIEVLEPMTREALKRADLKLSDLNGIAVTHMPGLVGSLLVGLSFAKGLAFGLKSPFIGVSHLEGHLNAPFLENRKISYPQIGLIVSGGHTALYEIKKFGDYRLLGGTRDDAAGEAFDKVAKLLGLGYPGGPIIDRLAKEGNPDAVKLPKPKLPRYDFSFSGIKTAVKRITGAEGYWQIDRGSSRSRSQQQASGIVNGESAVDQTAAIEPSGSTVPQGELAMSFSIPNICSSFQETVVDHLVEKTIAAAKNRRCRHVILSGGVACNSRLREKLGLALKKSGRHLWYPSPKFCTDNAAMIAYTGGRYLLEGRSSPLDLNAFANVDLKSPLTPLFQRGAVRI
ncbi:MAG: tRNA (adenosine(37)-N6)-threonylcarbamoyltransferase complex transferase subunit TsaD, partial [Deltaproteobacteria bacterium]|nr:tRNA (adenosine(37)-N6)-threonylcarbamoyltransferase complex transferase subunit TsaD [Deltaproteobacteria bacterium]